MIKKLFFISFFIFYSHSIFAYNYEYKSDDVSISLKFDESKISEIKFEFVKDNQKHFGVIDYSNQEININLNTNIITFDEFKKFFPKPQTNSKLNKKINFNWEIAELLVSDKYSLYSNKLNFTYNKGFELLTFYDSKKDFEFSILPNLNGDKQLYLSARDAGQFFYAQKITKNMIGGALIGKGNFRRFDDYDLTIKVKDFSVNKDSKFYNLIFTSRLLDIFSILQNKQDEFNYLEIPIQKKGNVFNFDHAIMLGGTVAFSFKGKLTQVKKLPVLTVLMGLFTYLKKTFKTFHF